MMMQKWMRSMLLLLIALSLATQGAMAAEGKKSTKHDATYRKVTGEVLSISDDSIVIKSRSKGAMTLAITKTTDRIGSAVKAGDKATVNYRMDGDKLTATRIAAKDAAAKSERKPATTASARGSR
jgi:hypothetical protein